MYDPYLSVIVGVHALTPPTRHSLGRPLPYQQADRSRAPPKASSYALYPRLDRGTMQDYPAFRRAILHFGVDSLLLLTRPPFSPDIAIGESFDLHA